MKRCGFTLIELLMATALTTTLVIGVVAVVADLSRSATVVARQDQGEEASATSRRCPDEIARWAELLREDMAQADKIWVSQSGEILLLGYGGLSDADRERTHRPVEVRYRVVQFGDEDWLIRRQKSLDVLSNQNVQRDLLCRGVSRYEVSVEPIAGSADSSEPVVSDEGLEGKPPAVRAAAMAERRRLALVARKSTGPGLWMLAVWTDGEEPAQRLKLAIRRRPDQ